MQPCFNFRFCRGAHRGRIGRINSTHAAFQANVSKLSNDAAKSGDICFVLRGFKPMGDVGDLNATFFYGFSGKQIYKPLWSVILQCEAHVSHDDHAAPLVEQQRVENVGTVPLANYLRIAKPCSHNNGKLEDFEFRITQSKALAAHMVNKFMHENVCWSMGLLKHSPVLGTANWVKLCTAVCDWNPVCPSTASVPDVLNIIDEEELLDEYGNEEATRQMESPWRLATLAFLT